MLGTYCVLGDIMDICPIFQVELNIKIPIQRIYSSNNFIK